MPRRGGRKKKTRTHLPLTEEELDAVPKSLVVKRTALSKDVRLLEAELRAMMAPFTSLKLRESTRNKMKEIVSTAQNFGARNLLLLYERLGRLYLKAAVSPKGPTFTFRLLSFHLESDLMQLLGSKSVGVLGLGAPLTLLQGFAAHANAQVGQQLALLFRGLFPGQEYFQAQRPKRIAVFAYDAGRDVVEVRNYKIESETVGLSSALQRVMNAKEMDFSAVHDAGELLVGRAGGEEARHKMKLNLVEVSPRLSLKLVKVEQDMLAGEVLYHALVAKSAEEVGNLRKNAAEKMQRKLENRKTQAENVARKEKERAQKAEAKSRKHAIKAKSAEEKAALESGAAGDASPQPRPNKKIRKELY